MIKQTLLSLGTACVLAGSLHAQTYATVDGQAITDVQINELMQAVPGQVSYQMLPKERQKQVLDQAIERELLTKKAGDEGVKKTDLYKTTLQSTKARYKEVYDKTLEQAKLRYNELVDGAEDKVALELWMKERFDKIAIDDKEAKSFYDKNGEQFKSEARVKARHILLKTEADAQEVIKELQKAGKNVSEKFIALAKEKSTGPSGKGGGDLGWFTQRQMVPEFSKEAFSLKAGGFSSQPVKTKFGYHVVLVEDKQDAGQQSFDEVKDLVKQNLKMQRFKDEVAQIAKGLREKAKITYN